MELAVKVDLFEYLIDSVEKANLIQEILYDIENEQTSLDDVHTKLSEINNRTIFMVEQIIAGHLRKLAERCIELNDTQLLETLQNLNIISETD